MKQFIFFTIIFLNLSSNIYSQCITPYKFSHNYFYCNYDTIDPNHPYPVPWMIIVYNKERSGEASVDVDYFDIYLHQNGKDIPLWYDGINYFTKIQNPENSNALDNKYDGEYDSELSWNNKIAQLYKIPSNEDLDEGFRSEWTSSKYEEVKYKKDKNKLVTIKNGIITWLISNKKDYIWHPVSQIYPNIKVEGDGYMLLKVRYKINGPALLMFGMDYFCDSNCANCPLPKDHPEVGASDWYCEQGKWIENTIRFDHKVTAKGNR